MTDPKRPRALINGFGRIGRLAMRRALGAVGAASGARAACYDTPFDIVAINDPLAVAETAAYLLQFDSVQGAFGTTSVAANGDAFTVVTPKGEEKTIAFSRHSRVEDVSERERGGRGGRGEKGAGGKWCRSSNTPPAPPPFFPCSSPSPTWASTSFWSARASF
jgi:hypothetical protein